MIPANYNLPDAYRGDTYGPITLKVKDQSGSYISFNDAIKIELHVLNKKNHATVLKWSMDSGTVIVNNEIITLNQVDGEKMKMPAGTYDYDLQVIDAYSKRTYLKGIILVVDDVTDIVTSS